MEKGKRAVWRDGEYPAPESERADGAIGKLEDGFTAFVMTNVDSGEVIRIVEDRAVVVGVESDEVGEAWFWIRHCDVSWKAKLECFVVTGRIGCWADRKRWQVWECP